MLLVFKIQQTKSELDLYTLPGPVNTTLFLSESCDIIADSVALVLNNYSLNMNRESSVVQLKDHNESSNIIVISTSFSSEISPIKLQLHEMLFFCTNLFNFTISTFH